MAGIIDKKPSTSTSQSTEGHALEAMPSVASGTVIPEIVDSGLEKQALRKFDMFLLPQLAFLTILAYLDRTNIGESWVTVLHSFLLILHRQRQGLRIGRGTQIERERF